ncbi:MAG: phage tail assembly chaperone [Bradymonadaceae bacterium]
MKRAGLEEADNLGTLLDRVDTSDLSELDLELPTAWGAFFEAVERVDSEELFLQLLHHTSRDAVPLSSEENFNQAYERNYMEMLKASFEVAKYNGFFGRLATLAESDKTAA